MIASRWRWRSSGRAREAVRSFSWGERKISSPPPSLSEIERVGGKYKSAFWLYCELCSYWGFPGGSVGKNQHVNAGDTGLIPGLGRSPGVGNGTPLQISCLGNPMGRGAWWATVHGTTKSRTRLSDKTQAHTHTHPVAKLITCCCAEWNVRESRALVGGEGRNMKALRWEVPSNCRKKN